jgi:hypothetical protein
LDWSGSGLRQVEGTSECDNKLSGPIKCDEFTDLLGTCQLFRKDSGSKELIR